jgi:chromosome segregation protein
MRGFKSFADKTVIEFKNGVTCVVGPNGSGKSNITDAVRWVLGEQRVKTLRGTKMEDVIFSGTKHRKSLGLAEVKLIFDNSEQFFPLEYDEISIVRRVHRSGESEYLLNQMPCRLKDVRELFMDTGIGREGYSIIGQGRIDEVLSNNKDERRMLFEEAAGIVKYKSRKTETEKKLKTTSDNLLRIQDILSEIEDRVEPLRIESERAEKYIELSEILRNIELHAFAKRYTTCEQSILEVYKNRANFEDQIKALSERQTDLKKDYDTKDSALYAINQQLRTLEDELHEIMNLESKTLGEKQLMIEKISNFDSNIERIKDEIKEVEAHVFKIEEEKNQQIRERDEIIDKRNSLQSKIEDVTVLKDEALVELSRMKSENEFERQETIDLLNDIEIKNREIENFNRFVGQLTEKINAIDETIRIQNETIESSKEERFQIQGQIDRMNTEHESLNIQLGNKLKSQKFFKDKKSAIALTLDSVSKELSQLGTEKKLLTTMEEEFEGYDKGVKEILKRLPDTTGIRGIVATLIEVPKEYEVAIEIALGKALQNIVCDHVKDAKRSIDFLRKNDLGRVTFLPLENLGGKGEQNNKIEKMKSIKGFIGVASDLVKSDSEFDRMIDHLLGRIIIVDNFETASELLKMDNLRYKIITLKGDVLVPGGHITGGSFKSRVSNVLGRKRRIGELGQRIDILQGEIEVNESEIIQLDRLIDSEESAIKSLRESIDTLRMEKLRLENHNDNQEQWHKNNLEQLTKLNRDYDTLEVEKRSTLDAIDERRQEIERAELRAKSLETQLTDIGEGIVKIESDLQGHIDALTTYKIELASVEQNFEFKTKELLRIEDDHKTTLQKNNLRISQLNTYEKSKMEITGMVSSISDSIEKLGDKMIALRANIEENYRVKRKHSESLGVLTRDISEMTQLQDQYKEELHRLEVKMAKLEVEKDLVIADLWDKYEMSIAEALQVEHNYPKTEVKQLKNDLKMLGTVNVNAIKEYEEVSERYKFLSEQKKDLSDAIKQLEKIIKELDHKMIELFKTHFELINTHFKDTFITLFNGGVAELLLTDYDDLLNCDIDIIAQPPGKKLQSINLLSGGEKALTAIALLFAILKTKPSPFCILDEIEAALDDVNVYRFAAFIKEYAEKSQFVVITHRKGTMEIADTLYGVTMEEYGISKILSVKLEDVEEKFN